MTSPGAGLCRQYAERSDIADRFGLDPLAHRPAHDPAAGQIHDGG